jgi:NAD(P)-dependent dehydrogenase (short-subunit alcohol dehydrogenase family)
MPAKTMVITGAGSGIGRRTAIAFLNDGWNVVLAGRSIESLEAARAAARADTSRSLLMSTDVTDAYAVDRLFAAAVEAFGRIDVLFNNAGTFQGGGPLDMVTPAAWRAVVDVNLTGAFFCAQAAFRRMKSQAPQGGRIINNGSVSAQVPRPQAVAYAATKHAVTGLTRALSLEGRPFDIACGQIDIGNAATDMTKGVQTGMVQPDGTVRPEPTMSADHVVEAVRYMASLPLQANVQFMTVMATGMPFVGRG